MNIFLRGQWLARIASVLLATTAAASAGNTVPPATSAPATGNTNVFIFGGAFHSAWFWNTFVPFTLPYEDNYFVGVGAQQMLLRTDWWVTFGAEIGAGMRISGDGGPNSAELWTAGVAKLDGFDVFNTFHVTPSLSLGLSFVTDPIGIEAERAKTAPKPVNTLVYMAPEIAVNTLDNPNEEFFFRIQHRSGGLGLIMNFDGSNAATVGFRLKF